MEEVLLLEDFYKNLDDDQLKQHTKWFHKRIELGESVDDFLVEALATAREAAYRAHNMLAYKVQLIGSVVIYGGNFAEMKTGEGKTLTIAIAAYVSSLDRLGVHVVTVNEYLVKRDAEFSRRILNFLGVTVGFNSNTLTSSMKQKMYACDVVYTTNSELAFDYLRDNMSNEFLTKNIKSLNHAIIDEGDSILIDEAQTPLVISGIPEKNDLLYIQVDQVVSKLLETDYSIDLQTRTVVLLNSGILKIEKFFNTPNLYSFNNSNLIHKINNALMANYIFSNGKEYIVQKDQIILVDHFTGRLLPGQSYNSGLQQAIQAKEYLKIEPENKIVATTTYQTFFRLFAKLSALSGTALTEKDEFRESYNMIVVAIPTNKPLIRRDLPDLIFGSKQAKIQAIVDEIKRHFIKGQPILVGTTSVIDSEIIQQHLIQENIPCSVLNAKNHDKEGFIIAQAGKKHAVTISTNIAGRGVDIKINDEVKDLGGLFVLGTERNDSRRIDNQLRGRSGRQGDPGKTIFFISLEDNIFKRFGEDKFEKLSAQVDDEIFDSCLFSRVLENIQKKIRYASYDARKNLIEYSEVLSRQQELMYKQRDHILRGSDNEGVMIRIIKKITPYIIDKFVGEGEVKQLRCKELAEYLNNTFFSIQVFDVLDFYKVERGKIEKFIAITLIKALKTCIKHSPTVDMNNVMKNHLIFFMDKSWQEHLNFSEKLQTSVPLRSLEQKSPLNIYIEEMGREFDLRMLVCGENSISSLLRTNSELLQRNVADFTEFVRKNFEKIKTFMEWSCRT